MAANMTKRKRRKFTAEYKAETVRLVRGSDKTIAEIARDLGLADSAVRSWVEQAAVDDGQGPAGVLTTSRSLTKPGRVLPPKWVRRPSV